MDAAWWLEYAKECKQVFAGERVSGAGGIEGATRARFNHAVLNSGLGAIALAKQRGAARVILLGYDAQHTGGKSHWHGDHPPKLGNAGVAAQWPAQFRKAKEWIGDLPVVNCSRETALTCFPQGVLEAELQGSSTSKPALLVRGMSGLGDNLHQRAVLRHLMRDFEVWLQTPWPCLYHDLPALKLLPVRSTLRTQAKNEQREAGKYEAVAPEDAFALRVFYTPAAVREHGSVLGAMSAQCGVPVGDFTLPVPDAWLARADALIESWRTDRPIMIYRPLVERTEWGGCANRNPDHDAYKALFDAIRDRYFVVSVADLVPRKEWMVGHKVRADVEYHAGELDIELLAGLVKRAGLVFTSPGFAVILAQAVGTRSVVVFGGYENSASFSAGAKFAPYLGIDPIRPCQSFSHNDRPDKRIDLPAATQRLLQFVEEGACVSA